MYFKLINVLVLFFNRLFVLTKLMLKAGDILDGYSFVLAINASNPTALYIPRVKVSHLLDLLF